jgi:hypothetical protein
VSANGVFEIGAGETHEIRLLVNYIDSNNPDITFTGNLTAVYVPFGADGDRALTVPP